SAGPGAINQALADFLGVGGPLSLAAGQVRGTHDDTDTLISFEYVACTDDADFILGGTCAHTLPGGGGVAVLIGGTGNDTMDGEEGSDTYLIGSSHGTDAISDSGATGFDWSTQTGGKDSIVALANATMS